MKFEGLMGHKLTAPDFSQKFVFWGKKPKKPLQIIAF